MVYAFLDTKLVYQFRTYKILEQCEEELEKQENPFALVVLAALYTLKAGGNSSKQYDFKLKLLVLLLQKKYDREKIRKIFIFIDALLQLPSDLEAKFEEEVRKMEGSKKKIYLSWENSNLAQSYYQRGEKIGEKRGGKNEKKVIAEKMLQKGMDIAFIKEMTGLSEVEITGLKAKLS